MKVKSFITKAFCLMLLSAMILPQCLLKTRAAEIEQMPVCTESENDMYKYEFPNGMGFTCTMKNGDKNVMIPFFMFDMGVSWKAYKNNAEYEYANYDIIQEKGNFSFVISAPVSNQSQDVYKCTFSFTSVYSEDALQSEIDGMGSSFGFSGGDMGDFNISDMEKIFSDYRLEIGNQIESIGTSDRNMNYYSKADVISDYNAAAKMFSYRTSDNNVIFLSHPNGMVTNEPVKVEFGENITVFAFKDDKQIDELKSGDVFSESGVYSISFVSSADGDVDQKLGTVGFRIINGAVNNLEIFNAPTDFIITSAKYENKDFSYNNENYCKMNIDGTYDFVIKYKNDLDITYQIRIKRDVVAPLVVLSNGGMGYLVSDAVDINSVEPGAKLIVEYAGTDVTRDGMRLEREGTYKVTVSDEAGNSRVYRVKIAKGFSISFKGVIITLVLIGAALAYLAYLSKQKVQVL